MCIRDLCVTIESKQDMKKGKDDAKKNMAKFQKGEDYIMTQKKYGIYTKNGILICKAFKDDSVEYGRILEVKRPRSREYETITLREFLIQVFRK